MAYDTFAPYYDLLNQAADYDRLAGYLADTLRQNGIEAGIVADLGCGTGEMSLRLAGAGYDMIGVDGSAGMLSVFRDKLAQCPNAPDILLLNQSLDALDLYGTVRAAVSCFDTLNHLKPAELAEAVGRAALFLEPGGLFLFDINTPYKHRHILADNRFEVEAEAEGVKCRWRNRYDAAGGRVEVFLEIEEAGRPAGTERFWEYDIEPDGMRALLAQTGLETLTVVDGESFEEAVPTSQRLLFAAIKPL